MLRVILIVFIGIALSACRSGDDVSSTGGKSASNNSVAQSSTSAPKKLLEAPTREQKQQSSASKPVYTPQPVTPPDPTDPISYQPVTLEWTIPMQRENGDLLSASDLDGYIIEFVDQSNPGTIDQTYVEGGQVNSHSLSLPPGSYRFRVIAVDNKGLTSNPSDWVNAELA